ncbi:hypothetical protein [Metabacillus endolithicus]|uniref:Uncharacterized protein n=2 Tax=Metabacillus endolithicus TaxID=1535204 RepID=A0ABW5C4Q7_9BACI|nr:hypothetical protein [Metabacillus endolithicus]UPG63919.1 hypothetical protein MVE64_01825 [Metabacillus endolithicus]
MGVRLAFQLEDGIWLELRRIDQEHFYAYLTNEDMKISDQNIGVVSEILNGFIK